ncbi:33388_t:CDS:1, partial [Racocetra persica]
LSGHDREILEKVPLIKTICKSAGFKYTFPLFYSELSAIVEKLDSFFNEDKTIKKLSLNVQKHSDHMYTSKLINTQEISQKLKLTSKEISSIKIPDNY